MKQFNVMKKWLGMDTGHRWATEVMAGMITYFAVVYIVIVNATILNDAGMPLQGAIIGTIVTSVLSCALMAFLGKSPIVVVPGMGINTFFSYTLVHNMHLSWQEALAVVCTTGILFTIITFTSLYHMIKTAVPLHLQHAISVGIGSLVAFIGLQKSELVVSHPTTFVTVGNFASTAVITACVTLFIAMVLFARRVAGAFLISMTIGTALYYVQTGFLHQHNITVSLVDSFRSYQQVFLHVSFAQMFSMPFILGVFLLLLIILFENIGIVVSQTSLIGKPELSKNSLRALSIANIGAGLLGTSPVVASVETSAGIAAGGKTGLTSLVTAALFGFTFLFTPVLVIIPSSAIGPVLLIIGGLMMQQIQHIDFTEFAEAFSAFLIIVMIPFTHSIVDGMAFGFVAYPIMKIAIGQARQLTLATYAVCSLFAVHLCIQALLG